MERSIPSRQRHADFNLADILLTGKPEMRTDFKIFKKKRVTRPGNGAEGRNPKVLEEGIRPDFPRGLWISEYLQYVRRTVESDSEEAIAMSLLNRLDLSYMRGAKPHLSEDRVHIAAGFHHTFVDQGLTRSGGGRSR